MRTASLAHVREERAACPLYTAIGVIEGRWKPMLFQRLARGPVGFGTLHRAMPGLSRKVLAEQLRQMEGDDLVVRSETGDRLGSVQYALTPYGETLGPLFAALWRWGTGHLARPGAERGTRIHAPERAPSAVARQATPSLPSPGHALKGARFTDT